MKTFSSNYPEFAEILHEKMPCILATVIQTQGSTPQKAGSSALIGINQLLVGTVGGGITELKVIQQAQTILKSKKSGIFSFDLSGDLTKGSESICGGGMTILLDAAPELNLPVFNLLWNSLKQRTPGVLITLIDESGPEEIKISRFWFSETNQPQLPTDSRNKIEPLIFEMLEQPNDTFSRLVSLKDLEISTSGFVYLERINPKPSLFIAGAGHIGQSLSRLGRFLDFEVTVWDDRPEYADKTQVPDADFVLSGSIDTIAEKLDIQDDLYLVIVTHGHKCDADVLRKFIGSDAAYIGMIGSKAKVSQMRMSFLENRWATPQQWERVFTPVGLDIGAQTVEEIALSIAGQLIQIRNQRKKTGE